MSLRGFTRILGRRGGGGALKGSKRMFSTKASKIVQVAPKTIAAILAGTFVASAGLRMAHQQHLQITARADVEEKKLPIIALTEVQQHFDESSFWVTYRGNVYDMTTFIPGHPGLKTRILMVGGQDLEPYWDVYDLHYRGHILPWMERFKIGKLTHEDARKAKAQTQFFNPYEDDPKRDPDLLPATSRPFNGEPKLERLTDTYYTPNEIHYVRNHLAVPNLDPDDYELEIEGLHVKPITLTLKQLKSLPKEEVVSTLQCAGNRREDFHGDHGKEVFISPHWVSGAISNARWGGAKLRDVLKLAGLDVDSMSLGHSAPTDLKHVQFEGYDTDETGMCYGVSIPIDKAIDPFGDCILAYEMNGVDLPRDHGYPVRALVPGQAGARNCKWINKITLSDVIANTPWQHTYRGFAPNITFENDIYKGYGSVDLGYAKIVHEMPVQSLICNPGPNSVLKGERESVTVKGVAWSGAGVGINRVDVSIDGGNNWEHANLHKPIKQRRRNQWGWFHFSKEINLPKKVIEKLKRGENVHLQLVSKAVNGNYDVQPENSLPYYNCKGVCINHWYRVPVFINPLLEPGPEDTERLGWWETGKLEAHTHAPFHNKPTGGRFHKPFSYDFKEL